MWVVGSRVIVRLGVWSACMVAAIAASAYAADIPPPQPAPPATAPAVYQPIVAPPEFVPGDQFEARFGAFYHGVGSVEEGTFDLNGSLHSPRLNFGLPGYWAYFLPRFDIGGAVNLEGRTSFAYLDIALNFPIARRFFFEPFLGGAIHDGSLTATPTFSGLGCPLLFHAGFTGGYTITEHWNVMATFEHLSNGKGVFGVNCGTNQAPTGSNQGLNNYGIQVGYAF
jgi:lipid A 3-O-deacylase